MRKLICLLLCLSLFAAPAFAETTAKPASLEERFSDFLVQNRLDGTGLSVSYYNTVTGERLDHHADRFYSVGRVWTLPLHMYYSEQEHAGAFDPPANDPEQVFTIDGLTLEKCRYQSILLNDDAVSEKMRDRLGSIGQYQQLLNDEFGHLDADALPDEFFSDTVYSTEFLLNCLIDYQRQTELFGNLMANFHQVQTDEGFGDTRYPYYMTHVRGVADGRYCDVGIISAPQPYLLACITTETLGGDQALSKINDFFSTEIAEASGQALEETTPTAARERRESDYRASAVQPAQQLKTAALLRWVAAAFGAALVLGAILTAICLLIRRRKHRHLREAEEYDE